jgi:hypothetical protein
MNQRTLNRIVLLLVAVSAPSILNTLLFDTNLHHSQDDIFHPLRIDSAYSPTPSQQHASLLDAWCQDLATDKPNEQPLWGPDELTRRRSGAILQNSTLRGHSLFKELNQIATDKDGLPIFPSEGGQDRWLWLNHFRFLNRAMVYADFGSNDPLFTSNTFFLIVAFMPKDFVWKRILDLTCVIARSGLVTMSKSAYPMLNGR